MQMAPNYFAYFPASGSIGGFLSEMLSTRFNVVSFNWMSSPATTELESIVMNWLGKMLKLPETFLFSSDGNGSSGGDVLQGTTCEAILYTLAAARDQMLNKIGRENIVYASDQTHCALQKAAQIASINPKNFHAIATSKVTKFGLSPNSLLSTILADLELGLIPLFLCATVGTASSTAVDPIGALCEVAKRYGIWAHVDAAYAGSGCICPEFRHFIDGVEDADSFSLNAHKWFFTALDCCCLWVKDPNALVKALSTNPEYLKNKATESKQVIDYKDWQIALSRRFRSMKLWLVLRSYGVTNLRSFLRSHVKMAKQFEGLIVKDKRFEIVVPRTFAMVCFRMKPTAIFGQKLGENGGDKHVEAQTNEINQKLLESVNGSGQIYMTHAVIGGIYMIRFAIGAMLAEERHVNLAWKVVQEHTDVILCALDALTLIFGLFLAILYFRRVDRKSEESTGRLPPGPPRWPIFGNLLQLGPLPHRDFTKFCKIYGPLVYLRLGSVDAITTNDPNIIREILVRQDEIFASRPRTLAGIHLAYGCGDVALAPLGLHWKRMRRICMEHLLSTKRLDSFANHRVDEARHLVQDVLNRSKTGEPVNLRQVLGAFSMNNVTRMLLGKQYFGVESAGPDEAMEFMDITHELFRLLGLIYLGDYLPLWRWFDPFGCEKEMRDVEKRMDEFHKRILEEHRKGGRSRRKDGDHHEMDFVDILLELPGEDGKDHLDDVEIKALIQDMIAAATDTSSVTNEWAMAEVIKHPRVLRKIQEELDSVVGRDRMVTESDLNHLNYLRCVVRETFRMHPAGPFLIPHESIKPTTINGYYIPAKTRVFINTHALGRNTRIWDDIDEFRPERHLLDDGSRVEISHGVDFRILPFSAGKRRCPGAPLGVVFVLMALARLFHCFDWVPPEGLRPEDVDTTEVYGMTMPKAKPLIAVAKPRLESHLYYS
ncbi:Cytochrome P450 [Macleaya cordata]|uniref:Cytochrome P450 n=1 Tax=Macleaya cordata TaxID=56857 RepID=A0A200QM64_MACCD|nr:Cytochrome P450 [Macleaya cordata]